MSTTTIIKGGGSSFENAERCNQFADRVQERLDDGERVAVVVSTPNFPGTSRTTDKLKLMAKYREGGSSEIEHETTCQEKKISFLLNHLFAIFEKTIQ